MGSEVDLGGHMQKRILLIGLVYTLLSFSHLLYSQVDEYSSDVQENFDIQTCIVPGGTCAYANECCRGFCDINICRGGNCAANGMRCRFSIDCCSRLCQQGYCRGSGCVPNGGNCRFGSDCCSGLICDQGICRGSGCAPVGAACRFNNDCCKTYCQNGVCK